MRDIHHRTRVGRLNFLTEQEKRDIFQAVIELLSKVGMKVYHEKTIELLKGHGCRVGSDRRVYIEEHLLKWALSTAPGVVQVYGREGQLAMELGERNVYFGTGSDLLHTYDLETGERRESVLADVSRAARLCDALPNIDFLMSAAHPTDVSPHHAYVLGFKEMVENSTKPLVLTAENAGDLKVMIDVSAELRGGSEGLREKPYFVVYLEPISPLEQPIESLDKLLLCAEHGVPALYSPAPLAGATAPVTVAGHTAQGMAESLFGLVVHQLHRPGAPFVFGVGPSVFDMVTAQATYNSPEYLLTYMCAVEMSQWLDLPNWGYGGTSDSQLLDAQAGMEMGEVTLLSMLAGSNLNHDVGYLDFGLTASLEGMVITDEFIDLNRKVVDGIEVSKETLAVDTVAEVGPGGHFMTSEHTYRHMRSGQWRPSVFNRQGYDKWEEEGKVDLREAARRKALQILEEHEVAPLPEDVSERAAAVFDAFLEGN